ncbi:hypothetical protein ABT275_39490 [Streptomyces sp. NPDC001185]|uniref:hypothetical protein n=1 Tax=Streptomyces sp. NPDC001185 TaxID=3154380 RepID=UPI003329730D
MREVLNVIAKNCRKRTLGCIAGVALATLLGVTGCSNNSSSSAKDRDAGHVVHSKEKGKKNDKGAGTPRAPQLSKATHQPTARGAVAAWVTAVIKGQTKEACLLMGQPATDSTPAQVGTPAMCGGDTPEARQMRKNIGRFRTLFTPEPSTDNPKVEVAPVPPTGDRTVIPAQKVVVDGQTLHNIILSHSTGLESGQLDVNLESTKIGAAWYVTNIQFDI